ncbi:MAG: DUF1453 family protein [Micromonosporaceae bacterium]|nr:DUF1453 family protein [Micromonosporaceae bacterium]
MNVAQIPQILLTLAILVWVVSRRLTGQPVTAGRLLVLPAIVVVLGASQLLGSVHGHLTVLDVGLLAGEVVLGAAFGLARGATIQLYPRDGHLWYRYRPLTIVLWVASIAARVGIVVLAHQLGAGLASSTTFLLLGLSLLGEAAVVGLRARRTGIPIAASRRAAYR